MGKGKGNKNEKGNKNVNGSESILAFSTEIQHMYTQCLVVLKKILFF